MSLPDKNKNYLNHNSIHHHPDSGDGFSYHSSGEGHSIRIEAIQAPDDCCTTNKRFAIGHLKRNGDIKPNLPLSSTSWYHVGLELG
jgi:hypothetical protein